MAELAAAAQQLNLEDLTDDAAVNRTNFPLPRELRDQIFGCLLLGEHVKSPPYFMRGSEEQGQSSETCGGDRSWAYTFRFETSILAVNREIHGEATKTLRQNAFVVVSHRWPGLAYEKHRYNLPVVTENRTHVARFRNHSLRVHFQSPDKQAREEDHNRVGSFLMLADDLSILCRLMQWILCCTPSPAHFVTRLHTMAPHEINPCNDRTTSAKRVVRTKLELRSVPGKALNEELEEFLLDPFEKMIIGCQSVTISGVKHISTTRLESLKEVMGLGIVFAKAMGWQMLLLASFLKWQADSLVRKEDYERAIDGYMLVVDSRQSSFLFRLPFDSYAGDTGVVVGLLLRVMLDAVVTVAFLHLKLGSLRQAREAQVIVQELCGFLTNLPIPDDTLVPESGHYLSCIQGATWLHLILDILLTPRVQYPLEAIAADLRGLRADMLHCNADDRHIACDLGLVMNLVANRSLRFRYETGVLSPSMLLSRLAASRLPAKIFDTPPPESLNKFPKGIDGFLDKEHFDAMLAADPARVARRKEITKAWVANHPEISEEDLKALLG